MSTFCIVTSGIGVGLALDSIYRLEFDVYPITFTKNVP